MLVATKYIVDNEDKEKAMKIRFEVFVDGQGVPAEEEKDQYEDESRHFLAYVDGIPTGTARWRFTEKGIKLERFAVLEKYRTGGVGASLVKAVLKDVKTHQDYNDQKIYLNSQVSAVGFYSKFGFMKVGDEFDECGIMHFTMYLS